MSEKEGNESVGTETIGKCEDIGENLTNEEAPASLEAIPAETALVRNGVQAASKDKAKIDILLKATGNAPIMKKKKWSVSQDYCIGRISDFIRRYLKLDSNEKLVSAKRKRYLPLLIFYYFIILSCLDDVRRNRFSRLPVSLRESDVCACAGSGGKKFVRVLRCGREIDPSLLQKPSLGLNSLASSTFLVGRFSLFYRPAARLQLPALPSNINRLLVIIKWTILCTLDTGKDPLKQPQKEINPVVFSSVFVFSIFSVFSVFSAFSVGIQWDEDRYFGVDLRG